MKFNMVTREHHLRFSHAIYSSISNGFKDWKRASVNMFKSSQLYKEFQPFITSLPLPHPCCEREAWARAKSSPPKADSTNMRRNVCIRNFMILRNRTTSWLLLFKPGRWEQAEGGEPCSCKPGCAKEGCVWTPPHPRRHFQYPGCYLSGQPPDC